MKKENIGAVFMMLVYILGFYGYVNNIVRIWDCDTSSCRTIRVIGAITTIPGAVMGFIDFD
ncbi:MAG: hypothetical protein IKJ62_01265 [Alphaproteobacteria bacterium]|nr:hypothetical protein [Alphaproteobacteria bacterium]